AAALVEAEAARGVAEAAVGAAEEARAELALRRRAEQLRAPWDDAARLDRQLAIARGEALAAQGEAEAAPRAQRAMADRRAELVATLAPIREARLAAGIVERAAPVQTAEPARAAEAARWLTARRELAREVTAWPALDAMLAQESGLEAERQ